MEARLACVLVTLASFLSLGASYRTQNFIVTTASPQFAKQVGDAAESLRRDLAIEWLGHELPRWSDPCPIQVKVGNIGAGGVTSFMFDRGRPFGWEMSIQGSPERALDSVLPHEITHTIFATHFGQPLPRWADEGACTTVEHDDEKRKQQQMLIQFLTTNRGIAFNQMFAMREYPADIMPLYSQGYSLARYLIAQGGKRKFVDYVGDGLKSNNWTLTTRQHYGFESLSQLQVDWLEWVRQGSPEFSEGNRLLADRGSDAVVRPVSLKDSPTAVAGTRSASAVRAAGSWYARVRDGDASVEEAAEDARSAEKAAPVSPREPVAREAREVRQSDNTLSASGDVQPENLASSPEVLMEWSRPTPHRAVLVPLPDYTPPAPPRPPIGYGGPPGNVGVTR